MKGERSRGFTLLELMAVVVVLAVVIALAIPALVQGKKHGNEAAAISSLRAMSSAQLQYRTRYGTYGDIDELEQVALIDASFADGEKLGYRYVSASAPSRATWAVAAEPLAPGVSGDRYFYVDESGVIRYREGSTADATAQAVD